MDMNDLVKSLKNQHQNLQAFLDMIVLQQRAIIGNDVEGLEETIKTEGALLQNIERCEKQMGEIMMNLSEAYSLNMESPKLTDFVDALKLKGWKNLTPLLKLQGSMKKMALHIVKVNNQNRILIEQARNFIKETITAVTGNSHNSLLDRRL